MISHCDRINVESSSAAETSFHEANIEPAAAAEQTCKGLSLPHLISCWSKCPRPSVYCHQLWPLAKSRVILNQESMEKALRKTLPSGRFENVGALRSRAMSAIRSRGGKSTERLFRMTLVRSGVSGWRLHPRDLPASPDVYFPQHRLAVFLDGCFWHGCPKCWHPIRTRRKFWALKINLNKRRDRRDTRRLKGARICVVRIWEHELKRGSWLRLLRAMLASQSSAKNS